MKLSVIIVNYNNRENILGLLDSLRRNAELRNFEVVVVDNASKDGSVDTVKNMYPLCKIIPNRVNVGFASAVNIGIRSSRGEYVLLLNPDTTVKPGTIDIMLKFMEAHPDSGAVGCKILNPDGTIQLSGKSFPNPMVMLFVTLRLNKLFPNNPVTNKYYHPIEYYDKAHEVEHLMASCLMVRRSAIDKAGMMDENFFLYCEDVDWCYRIHKAGYKIWYIPDAEVVHIKGGATRNESYRSIIEYHKSAWYFYKKYYWDKYPKLVSLIFFIGLKIRKWWYLAANFFAREKMVKY